MASPRGTTGMVLRPKRTRALKSLSLPLDSDCDDDCCEECGSGILRRSFFSVASVMKGTIYFASGPSSFMFPKDLGFVPVAPRTRSSNIDVNSGSSTVANGALGLVNGVLRKLVVGMAFLVRMIHHLSLYPFQHLDATQVRGISTFVFINKKLCLPLRKLPWIFFHQLNLHDTYDLESSLNSQDPFSNFCFDKKV